CPSLALEQMEKHVAEMAASASRPPAPAPRGEAPWPGERKGVE
ncbi:hypothetical protein E2320_022861, partial [Naja naja]